MKTTLLIILFFMFAAVINAQEKYKTVIDEKTQQPMPVGICTQEIFSDSAYAAWFKERYDGYNLNTDLLKTIKTEILDYKITIVMGTWCSDSRREVPRFYKILNYLEYPVEDITLIMVDRKKEGLNKEVEGLDIEYVPTIIIYKNKQEAGRIIEVPEETLEEDLAGIIKKEE